MTINLEGYISLRACYPYDIAYANLWVYNVMCEIANLNEIKL